MVTAQSISTPDKEREQSVYFGKTVVARSQYLKLLQKAVNQQTAYR